MCGIFATTEPPRFRRRLDGVLEDLSRRGPDASGSLEVDGILLAQTRLTIIGLGESGRQPAVSRDGRISLVYNGEIYNYKELAASLRLTNITSDTQLLAEVIALDPSRIGHLRGMFAFVAWDAEAEKLYAARDPFGIKPLYTLHHSNGGLSFCSQISPLLSDPDARVVDPVGFGTYLAFGHTGPGSTMLERVRKLEPGKLHVWARNGPGYDHSMGDLDEPGEATDDLAEALQDSVNAHLVADVDVGTFLSGGIDSTILTYLATRGKRHVRSFTIGFPDHPERDESALAAHNSKLMGAEHNLVVATTKDLAIAASSFLREHGEPFADAAMLPLTHLSEAVGRELKVVLCGEGADELFGGYGRYRISSRLGHSRLASLPGRQHLADWWGLRRGGRPWERALEATLAGGGFRGHAALLDGDLPLLAALRPAVRQDVHALTSSGWATSGHTDLERARHYDLCTWLPNVFLEKTDRATMAGSLEARVPFLDREVVAAAGRISPGADTSKAALRTLLYKWLPDVRLPDRKKGLAIEIRDLVDKHFSTQVDRQLTDPEAALTRWLGSPDDGRVRLRAARSPYFAFRLAMLDEWQTMFGERLRWEL